jgi:hypothetical protein
MICTAASYPFFALVMFFVIKPYCKDTVRMIVLFLGVTACVGLNLAFARTPEAIICRFILFSCLITIVFLKTLTFEYISLTSKHVTHKEMLARKLAAKDTESRRDELKENVTFRIAIRNHFRFFCRCKSYKSYI